VGVRLTAIPCLRVLLELSWLAVGWVALGGFLPTSPGPFRIGGDVTDYCTRLFTRKKKGQSDLVAVSIQFLVRSPGLHLAHGDLVYPYSRAWRSRIGAGARYLQVLRLT